MSEQEQIKPEDIDLINMSDDDFMNLDPGQFGGSVDELDQSTTENEATDTSPTETDGAAAEADSEGDTDGDVDTTSTDVTTDADNEQQQATEEQTQTTEVHQTEDQDEADSGDTETQSGDVNYKEEYEKFMAPFKAAKRQITPDSPADMRRLAQMGADYSRKMEAMKPYQRVIKTLEKNGLLDIEKVNFLIDLNKKDPGAIQKFLKDNDIDPHRLALDDDIEYQPTDHMIGDKELALDTVLDEIRDTSSFSRTVKTITDDWDSASRKVLMGNPTIIRDINEHMGNGTFDQVIAKVEHERTFGRLEGLSDLEAYKTVGDAIHAAGGFKPTQSETSTTGNTNQDFSQDSGSSAEADKLRNRKKAASPTKGNASTGKPKINLANMTDEQVMKLDPSSLP
jgi:hypothetical protein